MRPGHHVTAALPRTLKAKSWPIVFWWVAVCLGLMAASPAMAQYKWKDRNGQMHASDRPPPPDVPERDIIQRPAVPARSTAAAASAASSAIAGRAASGPGTGQTASGPGRVDPEIERRRLAAERAAESQARQQAQAEEQRLAAQRAVQCQRARQQLALYQSGQRLATVNAAGERVVVDDAARATEVQLAQRLVAENCR